MFQSAGCRLFQGHDGPHQSWYGEEWDSDKADRLNSLDVADSVPPMTTPEPSIHMEIHTLRDQALDPKRQMTVDRASGLVEESLVDRRLILAVCEVAQRGLTREQIEARLAMCSSNMLHGNWQAIIVGLLFDDHADVPHVRARRVR